MKLPRQLPANRDSLAGLAILGVCAVTWWLTTGFDEVPAILSQNVPPTFFPRLVAATAALLGGLLFAGGMRRSAIDLADRATASAPSTAREKAGRKVPPPVFWATAGLVAAAGVLIPLAGTPLTLGLVAVALPVLWGERRFRLVAALAVGLPGAVHLLFTSALGVRFPAGQIWNIL